MTGGWIVGKWAVLRRLCTLPPFESPPIERAFWKRRDARLFDFRRWMLLAGIFAFWIFFVVDIMIVEDYLTTVLTIRFVATAIALGLWGFFCTPQSPAIREAIIGAMGLLTIGANLVMLSVAGPPLADVLPFSLSMIMAFGVGLVMPRFRTAVWAGLLGYVLFWISIPFSQSSFAAIVTNIHFMSLSLFAALVGTFVREKLEREQDNANRRLIVLNEQAVEAGQAKDRLLASVSHELRTPVNAIVGFSEIMQQGLFGPLEPPRYRQYVDDIHASAGLLKTGIGDLLEVSRLGSGNIAWQEAETPLSQIIDASVKACGYEAQEAGVTLLPFAGDGGVVVRTDPIRLTQVLVNLIVNATKFSDRNGRVTINVRDDGNCGVAVMVTDTGCGIAAKDIKHVFEPFMRGHGDQYSTHGGGLGLGLSIARTLVKRMDGELQIESEAGKGTTVMVLLPGHRISRREEAGQASPVRQGRAETA